MSDPASPLRFVGRDVLFVHWPVPVDAVRERLPEPLSVDTVDGSAWLSVLAHEVSEATLASLPVARPFVQVNFRTYARFDGSPGVYFLSLDAGNRAAAATGRRLFGLPFRPARGSVHRHDGTVTLRCRRTARGESEARFDARYRPTADPAEVDPHSVTGRLVERHRYFVPSEGRRGLARVVPGRPRESTGVLVGEVTRA